MIVGWSCDLEFGDGGKLLFLKKIDFYTFIDKYVYLYMWITYVIEWWYAMAL